MSKIAFMLVAVFLVLWGGCYYLVSIGAVHSRVYCVVIIIPLIIWQIYVQVRS